MKNILMIAVLSIVFLGCKKIEQQDKTTYVRGRVFLNDEVVTDAQNKPTSNVVVKLSDEDTTKTKDFLYSTTSDADGYFTFDLLPDKKSTVYLTAEFTSNNVSYYGYLKVDPANQQKSQLYLKFDDKKQNAIVVHLQDSLGGFLPNAAVKLYNSLVLAQNDDAIGIVKQTTSDANGKAYFLNLSAGTYFINAKGTYSSNLILKRKTVQIEVASTGIVKQDIILYQY